jgi:hypothetical protein
MARKEGRADREIGTTIGSGGGRVAITRVQASALEVGFVRVE